MSRDQKKAESRRRILDAARDVFFRDGFMSANLDEMAEKAGVDPVDIRHIDYLKGELSKMA